MNPVAQEAPAPRLCSPQHAPSSSLGKADGVRGARGGTLMLAHTPPSSASLDAVELRDLVGVHLDIPAITSVFGVGLQEGGASDLPGRVAPDEAEGRLAGVLLIGLENHGLL